jgi:hypothetical protein
VNPVAHPPLYDGAFCRASSWVLLFASVQRLLRADWRKEVLNSDTKRYKKRSGSAVATGRRFFGQAQREALVAAAELGGLTVLGLVSEHACAALQWGIDRDFVNNTKTVIMYDMGAGSATATLVHYSSFSGKDFGKAKTFGQFEVKGVTWDANCGAADLDMLLVEHFAAEFNAKHLKRKDDVLNYPRVRTLKKAFTSRSPRLFTRTQPQWVCSRHVYETAYRQRGKAPTVTTDPSQETMGVRQRPTSVRRRPV